MEGFGRAFNALAPPTWWKSAVKVKVKGGKLQPRAKALPARYDGGGGGDGKSLALWTVLTELHAKNAHT